MSAFKPGDVALVRHVVEPERHLVGIRDTHGWAVCNERADHFHSSWISSAQVEVIRPLVVIDPENREQVARLADAFCTARWSHLSDSDECDPLTRSSMTEALNAYLAPKPTEPTGRYAIVMASGVTWCRAAWASDEPWSRLGTDVFKAWADMDVTSVEFEGLP